MSATHTYRGLSGALYGVTMSLSPVVGIVRIRVVDVREEGGGALLHPGDQMNVEAARLEPLGFDDEERATMLAGAARIHAVAEIVTSGEYRALLTRLAGDLQRDAARLASPELGATPDALVVEHVARGLAEDLHRSLCPHDEADDDETACYDCGAMPGEGSRPEAGA